MSSDLPTSHSRDQSSGKFIVSIALSGLLLACGPNEHGTSQKCSYDTGSGWPVGWLFSQNNPASCPINTPPGGRSQQYSALATIPNAAATSGTLSFLNQNSAVISESGTVFNSGGSPDVWTFVGRYTAGTIAVETGTIGHDFAVNTLMKSDGNPATATSDLTYRASDPAAVLGLSSVDPGSSIILTGEYYQSDLVPPIAYQWYKDGSSLSGEINAELEAFAGAPNSVSFYEFRVTDSQGRSVSATTSIATGAGCGSQLEC
jgi:hypothetical protein